MAIFVLLFVYRVICSLLFLPFAILSLVCKIISNNEWVVRKMCEVDFVIFKCDFKILCPLKLLLWKRNIWLLWHGRKKTIFVVSKGSIQTNSLLQLLEIERVEKCYLSFYFYIFSFHHLRSFRIEEREVVVCTHHRDIWEEGSKAS